MTVLVWMLLRIRHLDGACCCCSRWGPIAGAALSGRVAIRNFPVTPRAGRRHRRATPMPTVSRTCRCSCLRALRQQLTGPLVAALAVSVPSRGFSNPWYVCFVHTNSVASVRFTFFFVQFICFFG